MNEMEYKVGTIAPWYKRRWWLRVREVEPIRYSDGCTGARHEFYVPWWSWPLEFIHRLIYGNPKIELAK